MNHKHCLLGVVALVATLSCTKVQSVPDVDDTPERIGFTAFAHRATKASVDDLDAAKTRTYVMTAYQAMAGTSVSEYFAPESFGYGINSEFPDAWNTQTTHYWPVTASISRPSTSLSFFSWGPNDATVSFDLNGYDTSENRTFPTLAVTVQDDCADQEDILAAMTESETYTVAGVSINYNHILSAVSFSAKAESATLRYIVKEIKVGVSYSDSTTCTLSPTGTYHYARFNDKGTWDGHTGTAKCYLPGLVSPADTVAGTQLSLTRSDGLLMLIPQELEERGAYFSILYDVIAADGSVSHSNILKYGGLFATSLTEWKPGVKYNYIITIPEEIYYPITYSVAVHDWTEQDVLVSESDDVYTEDNPEALTEGSGFGKENW